jgi:hypothetical protein
LAEIEISVLQLRSGGSSTALNVVGRQREKRKKREQRISGSAGTIVIQGVVPSIQLPTLHYAAIVIPFSALLSFLTLFDLLAPPFVAKWVTHSVKNAPNKLGGRDDESRLDVDAIRLRLSKNMGGS